MKKFLLSLAAMALVGSVSAANTLTITYDDFPTDQPQGYKSFEVTQDGANFQINNAYANGTNQIRVNQTGNTGFEVYNTTAIGGIQSVVLTVENATNLGTWYMSTSNTASISSSVTANTEGAIQGSVNGTTSVTFTVPTGTDASYFHFNLTAKGGGTVKLTSIVITYTGEIAGGGGTGGDTGGGNTGGEDQPSNPGGDTTGDVTQNFITGIGLPEGNTSAVPTTATSATATDTGITYTFYGSNINTSGYLMVAGKNVNGAYISWTLDFPMAQLLLTTTSGCSTNDLNTVSIYADDILISKDLKVNEQSKTYTIDIPENCQAPGTIYKVISTTSGSKYNAQFASFTYVRVQEADPDKTDVNLAFPESNYTATIGGTFTSPTVTVNPAEAASAVVYSSTNAKVATVDAQTGAVTVLFPGTTYIKASISDNATYNNTSAQYTLTVAPEAEMTVAKAIEYINGGFRGDGVVKGIVSQVDSYNSTYGSVTYWISDDGTTTNQLEVYGGLGIQKAQFSSKDDVQVGASVVVSGNLTLYNNIPEFNSNSEMLSYEAPTMEMVATPVITPNGGQVEEGTKVSITCATEGAKIYYTLDGTTPTEGSTFYAEEIEITQAMTIMAIATAEGMRNSNIATAVFTILAAGSQEGYFDFTNPEGLNPAQERPETGSGIDIPNITFTNKNIQFIVSDTNGKNAPRLWAATGAQEGKVDFRIYTDESFTVAVDDGNSYHLVNIEFTKASGNFAMTPNVGTLTKNGNTATWTPEEAQGSAMTIADTDYCDVTFKIDGTTYISTVTVTYAEGSGVTTGVADIEAAEEGEAVYYNLQGVRVANPERGIFVKVQNGKAGKVIK